MSRTASKLTNSVRQAKGSQNTGQDKESAEGAAGPETAAEATATESPAPQPAAPKPASPKPASGRRQAPKKGREEEPLPRMPSRRVWPD